MVKKFKYLFKKIWYYDILGQASWFTYRGDTFEFGNIIKHTSGIEYEIISHPKKIGENYYKCLIIKL